MALPQMTENTLIKGEREGVVYFQFTGLAGFPELDHRVFSRRGGRSHAPFDALNVAYGVGDRPEDVRRNRRLVAKAGDCRYTVYANQVHGTGILIYTGTEADAAATGRPRSGDALMTDIPGLARTRSPALG